MPSLLLTGDIRSVINSLTYKLKCNPVFRVSPEPTQSACLIFIMSCGSVTSIKEPKIPLLNKSEFLLKLETLPRRGEFYTNDGIKSMKAFIDVLLSLREEDCRNVNMYSLIALSRGLMNDLETKNYTIKHFNKVSHPTIKLSLAVMLVEENNEDIIFFLHNALECDNKRNILKKMLGSKFVLFKENLNR